MAHFGVHGVREVDRRGVSGQGYDFAFRREHVDFGRAKVFLERAQEFVGIRGFAGPVGELLNPFEVIDLGKLLIVFITLSIGLVRRAQGAAGLAVFLVFPVRGDAELARRCMSQVRIWISTGLPPGPTTVVCSDWYMLSFGMAM